MIQVRVYCLLSHFTDIFFPGVGPGPVGEWTLSMTLKLGRDSCWGALMGKWNAVDVLGGRGDIVVMGLRELQKWSAPSGVRGSAVTIGLGNRNGVWIPVSLGGSRCGLGTGPGDGAVIVVCGIDVGGGVAGWMFKIKGTGLGFVVLLLLLVLGLLCVAEEVDSALVDGLEYPDAEVTAYDTTLVTAFL